MCKEKIEFKARNIMNAECTSCTITAHPIMILKETAMIRWMAMSMVLVWLTGCAVISRPIVYRSIKKEPVIDYFYLAPGVRVGDRARYIGDHPSMKDSVQVARIASLTDGVYEVVLEPERRDVLDFEKHLFVTDEGRVIRAHVIIAGEQTPLAVVSPSETGYFRSKKLEKLAVPQTLTLNGHNYSMEYILTYEIFLESFGFLGGGHRADVTIVHMIDPSVPMGLVKTLMIMDTTVTPGAEAFLGVILKAANPDVFSSHEVLSDLFSATRKERQSWRLVFTYQP